MQVDPNFMSSWLIQLPNLFLAALFYTLLGRFALSFFFPPDSDRTIWRVFAQVTQPVVNLVRLLTPRVIVDRFIVLMAAAWVLFFRVGLIAAALLLVKT